MAIDNFIRITLCRMMGLLAELEINEQHDMISFRFVRTRTGALGDYGSSLSIVQRTSFGGEGWGEALAIKMNGINYLRLAAFRNP